MSYMRGGKRIGAGRRRGTSKTTVARNAIAAIKNTMHLPKGGKSRPALEVLQSLLDEALVIAEHSAPVPGNARADPARHERFHIIARDTAATLAKYQAAQLRAITVMPTPSRDEPPLHAASFRERATARRDVADDASVRREAASTGDARQRRG
jgi:hypothetical protein